MGEKQLSRIQKKNRATIMDAALEVFSTEGFRGATLDQIAKVAGLSKPNVIYYFPSKEAIYTDLLSLLLASWLDPLREINGQGDPVEELVGYIMRKLQMSREMPRESRLFANEILRGAPNIGGEIDGALRDLVDEKAGLISDWIAAGKIAKLDPRHLIFSIWATTQHYADFDVQVRGILQREDDGHLKDAEVFLADFYRKALQP